MQMESTEVVFTETAAKLEQQEVHESCPVGLKMRSQVQRLSDSILDGFGDKRALLTVLNRISLASLTYAAGSTMFVYALLTAFNVQLYGWGPLQGALANLVFVVYFTTIMAPFSMLLAWVFRYKQELPYQASIIELPLDAKESYELALGGALSITGSNLTHADEISGKISCVAPKRKEANSQEIKVEVNAIGPKCTQLTISSQPKLSAIEDLLFGYTLAVDGGRNKANVEKIVTFMNAALKSA